MASISQGLKAGLAAGVIYGLLVGLMHFTTLEVCQSAQLSYISNQLLVHTAPSNVTAQDIFATDVIYYPMVYGIWGLIYGVIYGAAFALLYAKIPGVTSKRKGMMLGIPVFLIGLFAGPAFFSYVCSPSWFPYIPLAIGVPVSFLFGYILGVFFDSFGRLAQEQKEAAGKRPEDGKESVKTG